jgi:hypothetical protein
MDHEERPYYTLIKTSRAGKPAVVVVNSALRVSTARSSFSWHLEVSIDCRELALHGMPNERESKVLHELEDLITPLVEAGNNAVFLARITWDGKRELKFRVHDPELAFETLQELSSRPDQVREWRFEINEDPRWDLAAPELQLLEKDRRIN